MNRSDETCLACGARRDEHEKLSGACSRTNCKAFSDAYYTFNENWGGDLKTPKVQTKPTRKSKTVFAAYALLAILVIIGIIVWVVMNR
jgi:hypothetical protein